MKRIILTILYLGIFSGSAAAHNQQCGQRAEVLKLLKGERFSERTFATGKSGNGLVVFEFFVNPETGSFTVLSTVIFSRNAEGKITGRSCIVIGGTGFQFHEGQPQPEPTRHTFLWWGGLQ